MKLSMYRHIAIAASALGLLLLPVGCYQLSIPVDSDTANSQVPSSVSQPVNNPQSQAQIPNPAPTTETLLAQSTVSENKSATKGTLRISNKTEIPIRLALLKRRSVAGSVNKSDKYNIPAHWDFAPQEGSAKGLVLSLPQGNLALKLGDVLVAFAEDGSRRYWGPYVVGETSEPVWNAQQKEWKLVLQQ
jgi:hypothetical protein